MCRPNGVGGKAWHCCPTLLRLRVDHSNLRMLMRQSTILLTAPGGFRIVRGVVGGNLRGSYYRGGSILTLIPGQRT